MKHILFVDDDPDTLKLMDLTLSGAGYRVTPVPNGKEALKAMEGDLPDLVLLDIMMPVMDGYEVCRLIRANPHTAHVPVVMFSAKAQAESKVEAFSCGADGYLTKPITPTELIAYIKDTLEQAPPAASPPAAGITIGVLGSQGSVGTTPIAINVAAALASDHETALADFVPDGAAYAHLGLETEGGIGTLLSQPIKSIDRDAVSAQTASHASGLRVLGSSTGAEYSLDPYRAGAILSALLDVARVIVIDLGSGLGPVARAILPRCDAVAFVIGADQVALAQAQRMLPALREAGVSEEAVLPVCINVWGELGAANEADVAAKLGRSPYATLDYATQEFYQAIQQRSPLVLSDPESATGRTLKGLAQELLRSAQESTQGDQR